MLNSNSQYDASLMPHHQLWFSDDQIKGGLTFTFVDIGASSYRVTGNIASVYQSLVTYMKMYTKVNKNCLWYLVSDHPRMLNSRLSMCLFLTYLIFVS